MSIIGADELPVSRKASDYLREVCHGLDGFLIDLAAHSAKRRESSLVEPQDVEAEVATFVQIVSRDLADSLPEYEAAEVNEIVERLQQIMLRTLRPSAEKTVALRDDVFGAAQLEEFELMRAEQGESFGVPTRALRGVPAKH